MHLDRRHFLQSAGLAGAALVVPRVGALASVPASAPKTGFETRGGASWTTHDEELAFLKAVARGSKRLTLDVIGKTAQGRPLHLASLGAPTPRGTGRPTRSASLSSPPSASTRATAPARCCRVPP